MGIEAGSSTYYQAKRGIVQDGLVLHLDAGVKESYSGGTTWRNLTNASATITLQNGPNFNKTNGGYFNLDGSNDRILISPPTNTIRTYNTTTQFVIKLPNVSYGQKCILSYRSGGGRLYIGVSAGKIFTYYDGLSPSAGYTTTGLTANNIHICHVVCDVENNLIKHYLNGSLSGSANKTNWYASYQSSLYLGFDAGGTNEYMPGNFYQFSHYNRVLSNDEISRNYNALRHRFGL